MVGERVNHSFVKEGEYDVRLGLTLKSQQTGGTVKNAVTKKVFVFRNEQDRDAYMAKNPAVKSDLVDIRQFENVKILSQYSAEDEFKKDAVFRVELMSSRTKTELNSTFFRRVPATYSVKETFDERTGLYSYFVDEQMTLMAAYPACTDMIMAGYNDASVKLCLLTDPSERELLILKKNYGAVSYTH